MPLATYADLQTTIADRMGRPGDAIIVGSRVQSWIALYELRARRELRLRLMEGRATATIDSEYTALPTDFLEMRNFQLNTNPVTPLELQSPEFIDRMRFTAPGTPFCFAIVANKIQLGPAPNATFTAEMDYWKDFDSLGGEDDVTTNILLQKAPDLYLFGSMVEGWTDLGEDAEITKYELRYQAALKKLKDSDDRAKWSGATMVRRIPGLIFSDNRSRVRG